MAYILEDLSSKLYRMNEKAGISSFGSFLTKKQKQTNFINAFIYVSMY